MDDEDKVEPAEHIISFCTQPGDFLDTVFDLVCDAKMGGFTSCTCPPILCFWCVCAIILGNMPQEDLIRIAPNA